MPTNLPPECQKIEERYRAAGSPEEKIACLEELLAAIPKHKGTDHLRADLRRKLAKLKEASETKKGGGKYASPFHIDREGAGQVLLIGPTNAGKSALLTALTNATPEVAAYPFTTWKPTPGMMEAGNVQIQLIDTPSLDREHIEGELINLIRRADLILLVVDLQAFPIEQIEHTVTLLEERQIAPLRLKERYEGQPGFIFIPLLVVVNKCDDENADEDFEALCELLEQDWPMLPVSATTGRNLDRLKQTVFERLEIVRVYSKRPGKEADLSRPFVLKKGSTVEEFAGKVHKDFLDNLKAARLWGSSAAFDGQMVSRDHVLQDGDVVELRT
jgi:ribosome-interacting GTPase 1